MQKILPMEKISTSLKYSILFVEFFRYEIIFKNRFIENY